jgi:parallel beta-helix repeat protein
MSFIRNSSIYNGQGWGIYALSSKNFSIENNVFFNCEKFLTRALSSNYFTIDSNLMIAPRMRSLTDGSGLYDMVAGIDMYIDQIPANANSSFLVSNNLVQGGGGNGYVIPGMQCGETQIGFISNEKLFLNCIIFFNK